MGPTHRVSRPELGASGPDNRPDTFSRSTPTSETREGGTHLDHREPHFGCPALQQCLDGHAGRLCPGLRQVRRLGAAVRVAVEVDSQPLAELLAAQHRVEHAHEAAPLAVRDRVEHLFDLGGVGDGDLNGVAGAQGVQLEGPLLLRRHVLLPHPPGGAQGVGTERLHEIGKALLQPQAVPPREGDEVPKPLVRDFVRHDGTDALLSAGGDLALVAQQIDLQHHKHPNWGRAMDWNDGDLRAG